MWIVDYTSEVKEVKAELKAHIELLENGGWGIAGLTEREGVHHMNGITIGLKKAISILDGGLT